MDRNRQSKLAATWAVLVVLTVGLGLTATAQVVTDAQALGTAHVLAEAPPSTVLGALLAALVPSLLWAIRRYIVGRLGSAVAEAVLELQPIAEEYRAASADGKLSPEERTSLRERAILSGLGAVGVLGRVLLVGPRTAGKLVERHVEAVKAKA